MFLQKDKIEKLVWYELLVLLCRQIRHQEVVMPHYRYSGTFSFAPDRGSPNGSSQPFKKEFEAANDAAARKWVKDFKSTHQKIVKAKLETIAQRELTARVRL